MPDWAGRPAAMLGIPLVERDTLDPALDPQALATLGLNRARPVLVVLPGSRATEVRRLMAHFGNGCAPRTPQVAPQVIIPAASTLRQQIEAAVADWPLPVHIIEGAEDKFRAFRLADAALAASGTVTLELALAGTPMVVGYKVDA